MFPDRSAAAPGFPPLFCLYKVYLGGLLVLMAAAARQCLTVSQYVLQLLMFRFVFLATSSNSMLSCRVTIGKESPALLFEASLVEWSKLGHGV